MNSGEDDTWEWHLMDAPGFEMPENSISRSAFLWVTQCILLNSQTKASDFEILVTSVGLRTHSYNLTCCTQIFLLPFEEF